MAPQKCKKACIIEAQMVQARSNTVKTVRACEDCTERCLHIHGKEKPNLVIPSFFKVMIGDHFLKLLIIPPKFARTMTAVVGQKIELGDSSGRRWALELAKIDGYLAFQQGWSSFSMDHGLELGDFVVFVCISASHFIARIYKRSGCEQMNFPKEGIANTERKLSGCNVVSGSLHTATNKTSIDKQSFNTPAVMRCNVEEKQKSPSSNSYSRRKTKELSHLKAEHVEVPCISMDRVAEYVRGDRRNLSYSHDFETGDRNHNARPDMREDKNSLGSKTFQVRNIHHPAPAGSIFMDSVTREVNPRASLRDDVSAKKRFRDTSDKYKDAFKTDRAGESTPPDKGRNVVKKETVEATANIKKEKVQIKIEQCPETNGKEIVVKAKLDMLVENYYGSDMVACLDNISTTNITQLPYLDEVFFSCVVDERRFQYLPMVGKSLMRRGRRKMDRGLVVVRDVENRMWPLMYRELRMRRILTGGWYSFKAANRVEVGDECMFVPDSSSTTSIDVYNIFVKPKSTNTTITHLPSHSLL